MLSPKNVETCTGTIAESMGRGMGAIEFKRQPNGVHGYFRYYRNGKPVRIKIGLHGKPAGLSLTEIRTKAGELARLRQEIAPTDLKLHLERRKATGGTLADLLSAYLLDLERRGRLATKDVKAIFKRNVLQANPALAQVPACEIVPADIVGLLANVHNRGGIASANSLRSYLSAAFSYGLKADNDHTRPIGTPVFGITYNPVSATKRNDGAVKLGERVLTHDEIKHLWQNIGSVPEVSPTMAGFIKMLLCLGGQRPKQLLRAKWDDYDFDNMTVRIVSFKGGRGEHGAHLIPLTDRACQIIESTPRIGEYPFAFRDFEHYSQGSISRAVGLYMEKHKITNTYLVRDIRRTCKNLLIDAGVDRESRNLIQIHQLTGVDYRHYDRHDHLPEKRAAMAKYDALLESILNSEDGD